MSLKHIDLFSGLGGFAYGLQELCGGFETVAFCEIDKACHPILEKNFPGVPIYEDVRTFPCAEYAGADIVTGGFPCQGFSVAGAQRGKDDERYLWPTMAAIIGHIRPRWVIGENVPGIIKLALDDVLSDLENLGYSAQTLIIPACGVGAVHRRERIWIVANASSTGLERRPG